MNLTSVPSLKFNTLKKKEITALITQNQLDFKCQKQSHFTIQSNKGKNKEVIITRFYINSV